MGVPSRRCVQLADALSEQGYFALAEPRLMKLITTYTREVPGRGRVVDIPANEMPDEQSDLLLCDNFVLTEKPHGKCEPKPV